MHVIYRCYPVKNLHGGHCDWDVKLYSFAHPSFRQCSASDSPPPGWTGSTSSSGPQAGTAADCNHEVD